METSKTLENAGKRLKTVENAPVCHGGAGGEKAFSIIKKTR